MRMKIYLLRCAFIFVAVANFHFVTANEMRQNTGCFDVVDSCLVSVTTTRCTSAHSMRFYFDSETGHCVEMASGCSSSDNAFATLQSCRDECSDHIASSEPDAAARGSCSTQRLAVHHIFKALSP